MDNQQYRPNLLDAPISIFADARQNLPKAVITLREIVSTRDYCNQIEAIRAETDKDKQAELKQQLPAITPVARLHHRKKGYSFAEQVAQQWPLLMGDVDRKDNPGVDMAELKNHLARLPYVLLCAHSVRGGIWFIVRLPDHQTPDTLAAHFRYLQKVFGGKKDGKYFGLFGIELDASKGGSPVHLRYASFDAVPYFNDGAETLTGTYTPPPLKPTPRNNRNYSPLPRSTVERVLRICVRIVEEATDGEKHHQLLRAARLAGGYISGGVLCEETAIGALEDAISHKQNVADEKAAQQTIRDGIEYGKNKPIYADDPAHPEARSTPAAQRPTNPHHPLPAEPVKTTTDAEPATVYHHAVVVNSEPPAVTPAVGQFAFPHHRADFVAAPLFWDGREVYRFIRWAVIPDGYDEQDWPPSEEDAVTANTLILTPTYN